MKHSDRVERSLSAPQSQQSPNDSLGNPSFDLLLHCSDEMSQHSPEASRAPAR